MNRRGLLIALTLSLITGLVFGFFPQLDLIVAGWFYDASTKNFPVSLNGLAQVLRDGAMVVAWGFAAPAIMALVIKLIWPNRPLLVRGRKMVFLIVTITLAAGIVTNLAFKTYWGRPRPVAVTEFNGSMTFKPWWDPSGQCPKNCSFFSGEGATAFWTYAPASLAPPQWRPLAYAAATVFGVATSGLRVAFGGHFLTDVLIAGLVTFLIIWICHGLIFRWARTAISDERIDAALTRFAWPAYAWRQRLLSNLRPDRPHIANRIVDSPTDD